MIFLSIFVLFLMQILSLLNWNEMSDVKSTEFVILA